VPLLAEAPLAWVAAVALAQLGMQCRRWSPGLSRAARDAEPPRSRSDARQAILLRRGLIWRLSAPELVHQTCIVPSRPPAATNSPSDENASDSTLSPDWRR
jgi:hypothetical protein